jgi:hypothetical protein
MLGASLLKWAHDELVWVTTNRRLGARFLFRALTAALATQLGASATVTTSQSDGGTAGAHGGPSAGEAHAGGVPPRKRQARTHRYRSTHACGYGRTEDRETEERAGVRQAGHQQETTHTGTGRDVPGSQTL